MNVRTSEWDSSVFGLKVGKVDLFSLPEALIPPAELLSDLKNFDVLFVRAPFWIHQPQSAVALDYVYEMEGAPFPCRCSRGLVECPSEKSGRLEEIARTAFVESRFFRDPRLSEKAQELYARWLRDGKSCWVLRGFEDDAFLLQTWDDPHTARISLIAVRHNVSRQGIACRLLSGVIGNISSAKMWKVCVSAANVRALRLYEAAGFRVVSVSTVYHFWQTR